MLKKIVCLIMLLAMFSVNAMGAVINSVSVNPTNGMVTVTGVVDSRKSGETVLMYVYNPGAVTTDIPYDSVAGSINLFNRIETVKSTVNGAFSFSYNILEANAGSGIYELDVKEYGGVKAAGSFVFYKPEDTAAKLLEINASLKSTAKTETEKIAYLSAILQDENQVGMLYLSSSIFESVKSNINAISKAVVELLKNTADITLTNLKDAVSAASVLVHINSQSSAEGIKTAIKNPEYAMLLKLSSIDTYMDFSGMNDSELTEMCERIRNTAKPQYVGDFTSLVNSQVVVTKYKSAFGWAAVSELNQKYAKYFNMTKYNSVSGKLTNVCAYMADRLNTVNIIENVQSLIDEASDKAPWPSTNSSGGGGGGTSSPRSGSVSSIGVGAEIVTAKVDTVKDEIINRPFGDLEFTLWAVPYIEGLVRINIISQDPNGEFRPNDSIKREEFLKMLLLAIGVNEDSSQNTFTDVNQGDWFYGYVSAAQKLEITNGYSDGRFGVGEDILRQDMAVLIYRALAMKNKTLTETAEKKIFRDNDSISEYALEAVGALQTSGIINGNTLGNFEPMKNATRAEAAKMISELYNIYTGEVK